MSNPLVAPYDLAIYLGIDVDNLDNDRAQMLINDAIQQAYTIATVGTVPTTGPTEDNLPTGAASVIRAAVARIYLNPAGVSSETVGPVQYSRSAGTGAIFSKAERAQLRRAAGGGSAFSIDLLPDDSDFADDLPWWDEAPDFGESSSSSSSSSS